jgi:carboxyl-terminal processing protease
MVRLTVAHYYTPSGRCIQRPYDKGFEDYQTDYRKRVENGEMFHAENISFSDSLKYKTLASGRTVYGGGGIMPDIFVPLDTSVLYRYYNRLQRNNIVYNYILDYIDLNRNNIQKQYPVFQKFADNFTVSDAMIEELIKRGEKEEIPRDQESINFTLPLIKKEIKALIARDIYAKDYFYQIYNQDDTVIQKAIEIIKNQGRYKQMLVSKN